MSSLDGSAYAGILLEEAKRISGRSDIKLSDSLFDLGVDSVWLLRLASALQERLGFQMDFADLFAADSLGDVAKILADRAGPAKPDHDDVVLDPDLVFPDTKEGVASAARKVLLTGATGFVGRHLLERLVKQPDTVIYCLIRAADTQAARERLSSASDRLVPVAGDLSLPRLGLAESEFQQLATQVDTIVHCGAEVNRLMGYRNLRQTNVLATKELLRLAACGGVSAFHLISTVSAAGTSGYGLSKRAAEVLVEQAAHRGLRTATYRLERISGSAVTGQWQQKDLYAMLIRGCVAARCFPDFGTDWDEIWTPVDDVAEQLAAHIVDPAVSGTIHFTGAEVRYADVVAWTRSYGIEVDALPTEVWARRIAADPANPAYAIAARILIEAGHDQAAEPEISFAEPDEVRVRALSSIVTEKVFHRYLAGLL